MRVKPLIVAFIVVALAPVAIGGFVGALYESVFVTRAAVEADEGAPVLTGAGDISECDSTTDEATASLLDNVEGTIFTLGDNVYPSGTIEDYINCYDPTWGRHKARTHPAPGNHDYKTANASGYFDYFGAAAGDPSKGYYSYDRGDWHIVVLNSRCREVGGCQAGSPMISWLKEDLAANPKKCTLAYWHSPLFSSGKHGGRQKMKPSWEVLYAANADVIVNGHDHDYERFAPQDPNGAADSEKGIREFVVGTGGADLRPFKSIQPNSEVRRADTHGVLKVTLYSDSYDWKFVPVVGESFMDSGSADCR